ncbi:hypothetical protein ACWIT3_08865 [Pasteurella sp. P03HT]
MKIYFFKSDLNQYQIFPAPESNELENFIEFEVENESELDNKELVFFNNEYILVPRRECESCVWNGEKWVIPEGKQLEVKRSLIKELFDDVDNTAAAILTKWTRFAEEYKEREAAAIEYKESGFKGEPSKYITMFSTVAGLDNKSATLLILQQANGLRTLQEQLAVQRMRKYELKHEELSEEELKRIHDDIIGKMKALAEAQQ